MNDRVHFNGSPTVDGYYTTFDTSEVHRIDEGGSDEGGGGSSDFSTATVAVTFSESLEVEMALRFVEIYDDGEVAEVGPSEANWFDEPIVMPLYKGHCTAQLFGPDDASFNVHTTGDIVFDTDGRFFDITGDGTITISE
jgi:hypothetical protein